MILIKIPQSENPREPRNRRHQYAILASSPAVFTAGVFHIYTVGHYKYKTSAFVTNKCHLKVKSAGGTSQDGVFWTCALEKWGQVFTRVRLLVNLYWLRPTLYTQTQTFWSKLSHSFWLYYIPVSCVHKLYWLQKKSLLPIHWGSGQVAHYFHRLHQLKLRLWLYV